MPPELMEPRHKHFELPLDAYPKKFKRVLEPLLYAQALAAVRLDLAQEKV